MIITLMNVAVHAAFWEGMIFGWFRISVANTADQLFGKKWSIILQKPIWDCLTCMASIWTLIWVMIFPGLTIHNVWELLEVILVVAGMSTAFDFWLFSKLD
jgi:hypothetical protein